MAIRRGATPLAGAAPTLEASNQAQIDDLVQRGRTLEHTNKKLSQQLAQEHARSEEAILELQTRWNISQSQWKETCQNLLGSYRIVQKRIQVELEKERFNTLKEMKITREEKLLRIQRDFKITLFQMKEEELERKVKDAEDEKTRLMGESGLVVQKMQEKCADYVIMLRDSQAKLSRTEKDMEEKEAKLNKLVESRASLEAYSESVKSKLERTQLQLDGAQTKNSQLERLNDELKRTNAELTRQLEQWQSLETKEGEAAETERKQRIALEMELREIKENSEKKAEKTVADLDKAKTQVEKIKRVSVKPSSKQIVEAAIREPNSNEYQEHPRSRTARKSTGGKSPKKPLVLASQGSDIEEISDPNEVAESNDEDQVRPATSRKKGKRKATSEDDDDIEIVERPKKQRIRRAGSERKETGRTRTRAGSRAVSKQPAAIAEANEATGGVDIAQKNAKKRKINIFPTGNDAIQFSFATMSNLNDALNIPTALSPVKDDEPVPNRSTASIRPSRR